MEKSQLKKTFLREIALPDGITAKLDENLLKLTSQRGELQRKIEPGIKVRIESSTISLEAEKSSQRNKKILGSLEAHIKNMVKGLSEAHKYTLKICSGHFPMNVSVSGGKLLVKNFLGEKVPRAIELNKNAKVTVDGDFIHVESIDKEIAGQVAASIEQLTRRPGYDSRVFQDGCYIISKDGKELK